MKFQTSIDEVIFVSEILPERSYMFDNDLKTHLSIVWNTGNEAQFVIDDETLFIKKNCIIFLTEFYKIDSISFDRLNVIQFNRQFYCVERDDELGCRGMLFFGGSDVPKIEIPNRVMKQFEAIWSVLTMEIEEEDVFKLEMLKGLLQRFLILCVRTYRRQHKLLPTDNKSVGLIRECNYLVEKYYKRYTKVSDYAKLLYKSPKTLSNIFKKFVDKTPLQIINERRMLEAKRLLKHSDITINEIATELNFNDIQSFSHFFSSKIGMSPSTFRNNLHSS